jgi:hypothetical protein
LVSRLLAIRRFIDSYSCTLLRMPAQDTLFANTRRFWAVAQEYCSTVESIDSLTRDDALTRLYRLLPLLIANAITLPKADATHQSEQRHLSNDEWTALYRRLQNFFGEWDLYHKNVDPTREDPVVCSLADDLADVYRDIQPFLGVVEENESALRDALFNVRLLFYSHWGEQAIAALQVIHFRLSDSLE